MIYYKLPHPLEYKSNPKTFRIQKVLFEEKLDNLRYLLGQEEIDREARNLAGKLPTDADLSKVLSDKSDIPPDDAKYD